MEYPEGAVTSKERNPRILIADDQSDILESLRLLLKTEGYAIETAESPSTAVAAAAERPAPVDLNSAPLEEVLALPVPPEVAQAKLARHLDNL